MNVSNLCRQDVVGVVAGASLEEAATLMCEEHVGCLVVVTKETPPRVVGMLTDRDMALEAIGRGAGAQALRAGDLAKAPPVAVTTTATLQEAAAAMEKAGVRRLLVVEDDGGVVGIVSAEDLLSGIAEELAGLARALRSGIEREKRERHRIVGEDCVRSVFPAFGTAPAEPTSATAKGVG